MFEQDIAMQFVDAYSEQIANDLQIKYLNEQETAKIITIWAKQNTKKIVKNLQENQLINKNFYDENIAFLKKALQSGANLEMTAEEYVDLLKQKLRRHPFVN